MKSTSTVAVPRQGSVIFAGFETNQGQSAIMNIKRSDGKGIPFAADIHDETNAIIGNVGQGGQAFVRGIQQQGTIKSPGWKPACPKPVLRSTSNPM